MKTPSINDRVRVKQEVLDGIANSYVRQHVSGEGAIVRDYHSGFFKVEFDDFKWQHGFYGWELEVIEKAKCNCSHCK